jgi:signal transduction histidine kinase
MSEAKNGKMARIESAGETKELALIADTFNRTLEKLENTTRKLGIKTIQTTTLHEIREIISGTIQMEEVARIVLERAIKAVNAQAGYLAVRQNGPGKLFVAASSGIGSEMPHEIDIDPQKTLAGLALNRRSPILIEDIDVNEQFKTLNRPDIGFPRLLYIAVVGKDVPVGTLALGRKRESHNFEEEDVRFLQILLQQVAYNFENAKLYQDLVKSKKDLEVALDERKRTQDQLLASERMAAFGELSVSIANELNNPLTTILGYADILLTSSNIRNEEDRGYLDLIQSQATRAGQITRSLLDIVSGKAVSRMPQDINVLLEKSIELTRARMSDCDVNLTVNLREDLPPVMVDPVQMESVFVNLINNAINAVTGLYSDPAGSFNQSPGIKEGKPFLRIETKYVEDKIHICFKDSGPGIFEENLSRIFEPFYSTRQKTSQVGLGLWISQGIVKINSGIIEVKSEPGEGAVFIVILPQSSERKKIEK